MDKGAKMSKKTRIVSFWGKGGVGKTTCSASFAAYLAKQGFDTFLITSDPIPSLSDIMDVRIGAKKTRINGLQLSAIELDEDTIKEMWKKKYGVEVYKVISSFLPVDRSIIDYVAGAPGISDEFMLAYILDLYNSKEHDFIIWDTAPAGGTLRLVKIEEQFYKHLGDAAKLYLSFKSIIDRIKTGERGPLEIIESWKKLALDVLNLLKSEEFFAYIVTIPEWLGVAQTKRLIDELNEFNVKVSGIIVNQIIESVNGFLKEKAKIHKKYLSLIEENYSKDYKVFKIPMQSYEVRGINSLYDFSKFLKDIMVL